MKYLSVCSGIEAASVAWKPEWEPVAFSEILPFPNSVLRYHYPETRNLGDMTRYKDWKIDATIDILIGGTPCQSFSIAGFREGLNNPRGQLMLTYGAIANQYKPRWLVWENVAGVLQSNGGKDFRYFLYMLGKCGYGIAYRVLNAKYFGVPQQRRRVFVIGCLGDWRCAAAVLFERHCMQGDFTPSKKTKESYAGNASASPIKYCQKVAKTLLTSQTRGDFNNQDFVVQAYAMRGREAGNVPELRGDVTSPLRSASGGSTRDIICFSKNMRAELRTHENASCVSASRSGKPGQGIPHLLDGYRVRRLMPIECERLQGFPDNYTLVPHNGKPASDSARYHAVGNSMAVPVLKWLQERIKLVDRLLKER